MEQASSSASISGTSPPDELKVWCTVAGVNKGKVYGLGSESNKAIGKQFCYESNSSSVQALKDEIQQLKHTLQEVRSERDELLNTVLVTQQKVQKNDKLLLMVMEKMDLQPPNDI